MICNFVKNIKFILSYLIILTSVSTPVFAKTEDKDCNKKNPLYCKIIKFNKHIDHKFALELSDKIYKKSKAIGIDPNISLAILIQESGLINQNTYKEHTVMERYCENGKCYIIEKQIKEVFDMTIAQINIKTANRYGFNIERLFNMDLDYALDCHYTLLKEKMKICSYLGTESYSCYHSMNEPYRSLYVELVKRYL